MKKDNVILLLASLVTLVFGPGAGHLIIKEWKRAIFFISISLILFIILASTFVSSVGHEVLETIANFQNIEQFKVVYEKFQEDNSNTMLIFNIVFAGLWAYSIVDLFKIIRSKNIIEKQEK